MEICSIGFTKRSAQDFFDRLKNAGVRQLFDVRLNNTSQLAGFAKRDDLRFFLREILGIAYVHQPLLAPTQHMLDGYKKQKGTWHEYEDEFLRLMEARRIEIVLSPAEFNPRTVLLCSELHAEQCHRRLVIEYLNEKWGNITAVHL